LDTCPGAVPDEKVNFSFVLRRGMTIPTRILGAQKASGHYTGGARIAGHGVAEETRPIFYHESPFP